MNASTYINPDLLAYWELTRGETLTELTTVQVLALGTHVKAIDLYPKAIDAIHWTDGLTTINFGGSSYVPYPDLITDSFPTFTEQRSISNDSITFKISNVNTSARAIAIGGGFKNAKVNIYLVILNPFDSTVIDYELMYSGFIDYLQCETDPNAQKNEMTVYLNSVYQALDLQSRTLAANSVYQSYYPGDNYMSLLGIVNSGQTWKYK